MAGSSVATAALALHDQPDVLGLAAAEESARRALRQAGLTPADIDLFELHDAYSIYAALALEASGFAAAGRDGAWQAKGRSACRDGSRSATFGGSKARGETGGATGVYQAAEVVLQLQGRAGANQVPGASVGMAQCLGGAGATAATHIFAAD